jgi:hypothetical protein
MFHPYDVNGLWPYFSILARRIAPIKTGGSAMPRRIAHPLWQINDNENGQPQSGCHKRA